MITLRTPEFAPGVRTFALPLCRLLSFQDLFPYRKHNHRTLQPESKLSGGVLGK